MYRILKKQLICTLMLLIYWLASSYSQVIKSNNSPLIANSSDLIDNSTLVYNLNLNQTNSSITLAIKQANDLNLTIINQNLLKTKRSNLFLDQNELKTFTTTISSLTNSKTLSMQTNTSTSDSKVIILSNRSKLNVESVLEPSINKTINANQIKLTTKKDSQNVAQNSTNLSSINDLNSLTNSTVNLGNLKSFNRQLVADKANRSLSEEQYKLANKNVSTSEPLAKSKIVKKASAELAKDEKLDSSLKNETILNASIGSNKNESIEIKPLKEDKNENNLATNQKSNSSSSKLLNSTIATTKTTTETMPTKSPKHLNQTIISTTVQSFHLSHAEPLINVPHSDKHWMLPNQLSMYYFQK